MSVEISLKNFVADRLKKLAEQNQPPIRVIIPKKLSPLQLKKLESSIDEERKAALAKELLKARDEAKEAEEAWLQVKDKVSDTFLNDLTSEEIEKIVLIEVKYNDTSSYLHAFEVNYGFVEPKSREEVLKAFLGMGCLSDDAFHLILSSLTAQVEAQPEQNDVNGQDPNLYNNTDS